MEDNNKHYITEEDIYESEIMDDNFDEVLSLTMIDLDNDSNKVSNYSGGMTGAVPIEYNNIDSVSISKKQTVIADKFVKSVADFIKRHDDVELTLPHRKYIDTVSELKTSNLLELLIMRDMNKELLFNIMNQINVSGGEDFVLIQNYNILVNTQMKLIKESNNLINSLPNEIKALRNDILTSKELINADTSEITDAVVSSNNTHNNGKDLLKQIEEEERLQLEKNNKN